jgi:hypothetical protein
MDGSEKGIMMHLTEEVEISSMAKSKIIQEYLDLLDEQRERAIAALEGITPQQLWQRPEPKEWCIGEILNHNVLLFRSVFPIVRFAWRYFRWTGKLMKNRKFHTAIEDPYRKKNFPMWVGFLWSPKYTPDNPVPLEKLLNEQQEEHAQVRKFYTGKDEAVLGNMFLFDPLFGFVNLIVTLQIGIYHDQLHYEDVIALANALKTQSLQDA